MQEQATELYSPGSHVGTLTTEPNFLLSEPGQDTETYSFGRGGGEPLHPFLILFWFGAAGCSSHAGQGYLNLMISSHMFFSIS